MKKVLQSIVLLLGVLMLPTAAYAQDIYADVNGDLEVNIGDINAVIDVILNDATILTADVNQDGEINIADINVIISVILGDQPKTLYSTILVTTSDGVTVEHLIDQNSHVSIEKPNLIIETDGKVLTYDLEQMARLCYGHRYVTAGQTLGSSVPQQEDGVMPDGDNRPQYALFTYRNDGDFNAFLNIDVDSITYSNTDLNGVAHGNAVVQQVWTPDSLYRIPLAAIDSVCFKAPETKYKPNVYHITNWHFPYVVKAEGLSLFMKRTIAADSIPAIGQVVISDVIEEPLEHGFSGRVLAVESTDHSYIILCEPVALTDIFERLLLVGRSESFTPEEISSGIHKTSIKSGDEDWDGVLPFELGKFKLNIPSVEGYISNDNSDMSLGSIAVEPKFYVSYLIDIKPFVHSHVKVLFENRSKTTFESHLKVEGNSPLTETKKSSIYFTKVPIPIVTGILYGEVALGGELYLKGNLDLKAVFTKTIYNGDEYEWDTSDFWNLYHKRYDNDPRKKDSDDQDDSNQWQSEAVLSVNGSFGFGLSLDLILFAVSENTLEISNTTSVGPELSGSLSLSSQGLEDGTLYSVLKDTKVSFTPLKLSDDVKFNICMRQFTLGSWSHDFGKKDYKLFPDFTAPSLPAYDMFTREGYKPLGLYTTVTKDVLPIIPLKIGIGVYDSNGTKIDECFASPFYQYEKDWDNRWLQYDVSQLAPSNTYKFHPMLRIWGAKALQVKAMPETEMTIPNPVSLEVPTVSVPKDGAQNIAIKGGWGDYTIDNSNSSKCSAELKKDESGDCYIHVVGLSEGSSTVTVKDLRSGDEAAVLVTVGGVTPQDNYEYVDLGLPSGTLWATCNIGASAPEEYGDYFAWGETEPKENYDWSTYKWCNGSYDTLTKYVCSDSSWGYNGFTDGKTELDLEDDAAYVNWGPSWRMPTQEQIEELVNHCSYQWTTLNGVNGNLVTGPNGNAIFLPAAGDSRGNLGMEGNYWSRTCFGYAIFLYLEPEYWGRWSTDGRFNGKSVRAVRISQN